MPSPGKALAVWDAPLFEADDMVGRLDTPGAVADDLINDYVFGSSLFPTPVTLDYIWLVQPLAWRPVPPINATSITRVGAAPTYVSNSASRDEYGTFDPGAVTLETALDADPLALGTYLTTYQADPLQRPPLLTVDLLDRTETEQWLILSVTEGTRIILTNCPSTWPAQCLSVFVDGIDHEIGLDTRQVVFTCTPLIGQVAGQVGPWFAADRSAASGTDIAPF